MGEFGYEKLDIWKEGMELVEAVYRLSKSFPPSEPFGLTAQLRRSAISIPSNIAEGSGRGSKPAFVNFARISQGSLFEVRTQLEIAVRIGFVTEEEVAPIMERAVKLSRMIDGFIKSLDH